MFGLKRLLKNAGSELRAGESMSPRVKEAADKTSFGCPQRKDPGLKPR
jgi:hypothetical protein